MQITLEAEDYFALLTGLGSNDVQVPRRLVGDDFVAAPSDVRPFPVPYPYGDLSTVASATAPPTLTGTASLGAILQDGLYWTTGYGSITCAATPPTAASLTAAASGTISADVPNSEYAIIVTAVDANGVESSSYPYYYNQAGSGRGSWPSFMPRATVSGSTQKLQASWSGATGAVTYRVYLGYYYYGAHFMQMIETASTSCEFTAGPSASATITQSNITPGATIAPAFNQLWWYAVTAIMSDGETGLSAEAFAHPHPYRRPNRIEWLNVPGALAYRVYKRGTVGGYQWRFDVPAGSLYFDDDHTNANAVSISGAPRPTGKVPTIAVGLLSDAAASSIQYYAFLVAGCAVKSIEALYIDGVRVDESRYGVDIFCPGKSGFSARFGATTYRTINGRRYTLVYFLDGSTIASGERMLTAAVKGIETIGDGSGALVTDVFDQYLHFLRNLVVNEYAGANWLTSGPTWGDTPNDVDILDATSFSRCRTIAAARLSGGYPGAFIIGVGDDGKPAQATVRNCIKWLNQSADCYSGFSRKSQYMVAMLDEREATRAAAPLYTAELGINRDSFSIVDDTSTIENKIKVKARRQWSTAVWDLDMVVEDVDAQTAIDEVKPYDLDLWCINDAGVAYDVAARRLARRKYPYRTVTFQADMGALTVDLGDLIRVTHPFGFGASGWVERPCFIMRHQFDPKEFLVQIEALDIAYLYDRPTTGASVPSSTTLDATSSIDAAFAGWLQSTSVAAQIGNEAIAPRPFTATY